MVAYILKIIGLAPFSISNISLTKCDLRDFRITAFQSSKIGLVYNILCFILVLSTSVFVMPRWISAIFSRDASTHDALNIVDLMTKFLYIITACVIILSWGFRQKNAACMMNRLLEVDIRLFGFGKQPVDKQALIFYVIHITANTVSWIGGSCLTLLSACSTELIISSFELTLIAIIYWFIFEYFIIVSLIARNLKAVNNHFLALKESRNHLTCLPQVQNIHLAVAGHSTHDSGLLASVESLHTVRTTLFELCEDITDFFSLPILFSISAVFVPLVNGLCLIVLPSDSISPLTDITIAIFLLIMWYLYPVVALVFGTTRAKKEAGRTGHIVHQLSAAVTEQEIRAKLAVISLQLLHENISFTACGCFEIDSTLLMSILGATATYFIVLIQFQQTTCTCENTSTTDSAISNTTSPMPI